MSTQPPRAPAVVGDSRQVRQADRQRTIAEMVMAAGTVRIDDLAARLGVSMMTIHRDLDELEGRGLLRKSRGAATALSSSLVESSDVYRAGQQLSVKKALAVAALQYIAPGQSVFLDDSTTVLQITPLVVQKVPLTVITNALTVMNELRGIRGISLIALGGSYYNWCSAFMGDVTNAAIGALRTDLLIMSTAAVVDGTCYFQSQQTVATKRAMFDAAARRILLVDHTKFQNRALHALAPLRDFDVVIMDAATDAAEVEELREGGVTVEVISAGAESGSPRAIRGRGVARPRNPERRSPTTRSRSH